MTPPPRISVPPPVPGMREARRQAHHHAAFHRSEAERCLENAEGIGHEDSRACEQYAAMALAHVKLADHYLHYVEHAAKFGDLALDES